MLTTSQLLGILAWSGVSKLSPRKKIDLWEDALPRRTPHSRLPLAAMIGLISTNDLVGLNTYN